MANKFLDRAVELAQPILEQNGCELVDAEFKKEGQDKILRLKIERLEGRVSLDDCAEVNRALSEKLDEIDDGQENYILEISSPGVNRPLNKERDYIRFAGSKVDVSLYEAMDGRKKFTCVLEGYEKGVFLFSIDGDALKVAQDKVGKINLHFDF